MRAANPATDVQDIYGIRAMLNQVGNQLFRTPSNTFLYIGPGFFFSPFSVEFVFKVVDIGWLTACAFIAIFLHFINVISRQLLLLGTLNEESGRPRSQSR